MTISTMSNLGESVDNINLCAVNEEDDLNVISMEEIKIPEHHISKMTQENINSGLSTLTIEEEILDISNVERIEETVTIHSTDEEEHEIIHFVNTEEIKEGEIIHFVNTEEIKEGSGEVVKVEKHDIQVSDILMEMKDTNLDVVHSEEKRELDTKDKTQRTESEGKHDLFVSFDNEGSQLKEAFGIEIQTSEILKNENIIKEDKTMEGRTMDEKGRAQVILKDENNTNEEISIEVELQISDIKKEDDNLQNDEGLSLFERKVQTLDMLTEDNMNNTKRKIGKEIVQPHKLVKEVYKCGLSQDDHEEEKLVDVDYLTERDIIYKIRKYLPDVEISSVKRVANNFLKGLYYLKKEEYESRNVCTREEVLFHSTARKYVDSIIKDNFDWTRVHRCKFGKGISFSTDADYANCHANRRNGLHRAFIITKVLVGRSKVGYGFQKIPHDGYDTTTGAKGMVIVKYKNNEYLPEYVVYYEKDDISESKYY